MPNIRINSLPTDAAPNAADMVPIDGLTTRKSTLTNLVNAGRPFASQAEAEAGTVPTKAMSPLTTAQAIAAQGAVAFAPIGRGLPPGGTINQVLGKTSGADYATSWRNAGAGDLLSGNNLSDVGNLATARGNLAVPNYVATRTAMRALDITKDDATVLNEIGRAGIFRRSVGDLSARVTADPGQGIFIPPNSDTSGASGARERVFYGAIYPEWWGAKGDTIEYLNGATTSGSTLFICSNTMSFTSDDIGKKIAIQKGGAAGVPLLTTIAALVPGFPQRCTLSVAAGSTQATTSFYYGTDDTTAINAALAYAGSTGLPIAITNRYLVTGLTAAGSLSMIGMGENVSQIIMHGATANFQYSSATAGNLALKTISLKMADFSFLTGYELNTAALGVAYASFTAGFTPYETLRATNVHLLSMGGGYTIGFNFNEATSFTLVNVVAVNKGLTSIAARDYISGSIGINIQGSHKPIDMYMFGCRAYFQDTGIKLNGQAVFANTWEGFTLIGCAVIICNVCLDVTASAGTPYLNLIGNNFNGYSFDVRVADVTELHIVDNEFYSVGDAAGLVAWAGIQINTSIILGTNRAKNIIAGNMFSGLNSPGTTTYAMTFDAAAGANLDSLIDANVMVGCTGAGIVLFSGANNIVITETNMFTSCTTNVSDASTTNTNTYLANIPLGLGKQVITAEQFSLSNANISGVNSTAVQNWFTAAQDTFNVKADTTYDFEAKLLVNTTGTNNHALGLQFGGTATFTDFHYNAMTSNSSNALSPAAVSMTEAASTANVLVTSVVAAATQNVAMVRGTMRINAAGTFIPQFAYNAIPGAVPTIIAGTYFRLWPKGNGSVVAVGAS